MNPSFIVNSVELFARQGTGVRTFSRSLVASLASTQEGQIDLLISTSSKSEAGALTGSNILQKHARLARIGRVISALRVKASQFLSLPWRRYCRRTHRVPASTPLHDPLVDQCFTQASRGYYVTQSTIRPVTGARGFLFGRHIFNDAVTTFRLTRHPLRLQLPAKGDFATRRTIFHNPLPFPLVIDKSINICTIHDLIPLTHPDLCLDDPAYFYDLVTALLEQCDGLHCISNYTANTVRQFFGVKNASKLFVANQPVPLSHLTSEFRDATLNGLHKKHQYHSVNTRYILQIGSIEPKKNHHTTLEAFHRLREQDSSLRLVIIGKPGWLTSDICDYLSTAKTDGIEWLRSANYGTMIRYIQGASAVVFPSIVEGWGLPPLEAMSYGTPVVVSPIDACLEACGTAATYMDDPLDSLSLARAVKDILLDVDHAISLSKAGFTQAEKYSPNQFAKDLMAGYTRNGLKR